jgi:ABC-type ATPase involved in cell division
MVEPLLAFEALFLESGEGRLIFQSFTWSLDRAAKINLKLAAGGDAIALLKLAAGALHPQRGRVVLDGVPLGPYAFDHPFLRRGALGWVPKEGGLLVNQTLLANVALPLMFVKGIARTSAEALASEALNLAGLTEVASHRPHALEPVERWLGALVRASIMDPELWLVAPPPGELPPPLREAAYAILGQAASSKAAMILAMDETWFPAIATQTIRLEQGKMNLEVL